MPAARVADRSPLAAHSPLRENGQMIGAKGREDNDGQREEKDEAQQKDRQENAIKSEEQRRRERERCGELMERRELLERRLIARLEELKGVCIAEGELTGHLPKEIYKCLLPGESEPTVKRRVGTAFKFPQELLDIPRNSKQNNGTNDGQTETAQLVHLEAEIELNRRIVAAAERLANDKSANKSVRKKRRKDLQAASHRLRGLEKGLHQMRLSSSKPDVSSLAAESGTASSSVSIGRQSGSGFSLNSLKAWPNFYQTLRMSTKSCPSTPRGSVPDLSLSVALPDNNSSNVSRRTTPSTAKKLHNMLSRRSPCSSGSAKGSCVPPAALPATTSASSSGVPSSSSSCSLNAHPSASTSSSSSGFSSAASSSNLLLFAPPVPSRRSSSGSGSADRPTPPRHRRDAPPWSSNSPTGGDAEDPCGSHLYANIGYLSSAPYKSAYRQCQFPTMLQQSPCRSSQHPPMMMSTSFSALKDLQTSPGSSPTSAAHTQLGHIVRRLDSGHPLRISAQKGGIAHSTGSLDRRMKCSIYASELRRNPMARTTPVKKLAEGEQQMVTTFPADGENGPKVHLLNSSAPSSDFSRFRSISAVLQHKNAIGRGDAIGESKVLPHMDTRMEALLASIQRQQNSANNSSSSAV